MKCTKFHMLDISLTCKKSQRSWIPKQRSLTLHWWILIPLQISNFPETIPMREFQSGSRSVKSLRANSRRILLSASHLCSWSSIYSLLLQHLMFYVLSREILNVLQGMKFSVVIAISCFIPEPAGNTLMYGIISCGFQHSF